MKMNHKKLFVMAVKHKGDGETGINEQINNNTTFKQVNNSTAAAIAAQIIWKKHIPKSVASKSVTSLLNEINYYQYINIIVI